MAKLPAAWAAPDGASTVTRASGGLLLESGGYLLQENLSHLLLEDIVLVPKEDTSWDAPPAKALSAWSSQDGSSTAQNIGLNNPRVGTDGVSQRLLQNGTDTRIVNEIIMTPKEDTKWDDL